jgi:hypothetical protein
VSDDGDEIYMVVDLTKLPDSGVCCLSSPALARSSSLACSPLLILPLSVPSHFHALTHHTHPPASARRFQRTISASHLAPPAITTLTRRMGFWTAGRILSSRSTALIAACAYM